MAIRAPGGAKKTHLASAIAPDTDSVAPALTVALNKNVFFYSMKIKYFVATSHETSKH